MIKFAVSQIDLHGRVTTLSHLTFMKGASHRIRTKLVI